MPWFYCRPVNVSFLFCAAKAEVETIHLWRSALLGVRPLQAVNTPSLKEHIEKNYTRANRGSMSAYMLCEGSHLRIQASPDIQCATQYIQSYFPQAGLIHQTLFKWLISWRWVRISVKAVQRRGGVPFSILGPSPPTHPLHPIPPKVQPLQWGFDHLIRNTSTSLSLPTGSR